MAAVFNMPEREAAIYALAASWASIDGKLEKFVAEPHDYGEGYLSEAEEMLARLERRGFTLTRFVSPARPTHPAGET